MKYTAIALVLFLTSFLGSMVYANEPIGGCTLEFAPVCGSIKVQCVTAACGPVRVTFGNQCLAKVANATHITTGECVSIPPVVGGEGVIHGCSRLSPYYGGTQNPQCLRPWESQIRILYNAPNKDIYANSSNI